MDRALHKDREPEETIATARRLLSRVGIEPREGPWFDFLGSCHSVRLRGDPELPHFCTNGKGVSPRLALASAYGELMERLQNGGGFGALLTRDYGLMTAATPFHPDEREVPTSTVFQRRSLLDSLLACSPDAAFEIVAEARDTLTCVPFYDVAAGTVEDLPLALLELAGSNNGKCAGNTPYEALVQGICEIFERYVVHQLFTRTGIGVPTVPESAFAHPPTRALIARITGEGYTLLIKDCSLGGRFPVLGVVLLDRDRTRWACSFGSDPVLEIALQRSLTELVQGLGVAELEARMVPLEVGVEAPSPEASRATWYRRFLRFFHVGEGPYPSSLLLSAGDPSHRTAFLDRFGSNRDCLRHCLALIAAGGHRLLVRDVSFLGFPAYRVYIPGLSEVVAVDEAMLAFAFDHRQRIQRCLLRFDHQSPAEIRQCAGLIERFEALPFFSVYQRDRVLQNLMSIEVKDATAGDFSFLPVSLLLSMLYLCADDPTEAFAHLDAFARIARDGGPSDPRGRAYYQRALAFLKLRAEGHATAAVGQQLLPLYGALPTTRILLDLGDPERVRRRLQPPDCGDCRGCRIAESCGFERWSEVRSNLAAAFSETPVSQAELAALF